MSSNQWWNSFERKEHYSLVLDPFIFTKTCLEKCMEFKEKNSAGKLEIWRVEDGVRRKVISSYWLA